MTEEQIEKKAEEYSEAFIAKGVAKASFIKGVKFGLKLHSHDYLIKTINLKKEHKKQIEKMKNCINCELFIKDKCPYKVGECKMKYWKLKEN